LKIKWTPEAHRDRHDAINYVAERDPGAAERLDTKFLQAVQRLSKFPHMGRPGIFPNTRELIPHPSYRITYMVGEDTIYILALLHASRQWPPVSED
jgi:toxin ParE1/3/4